MGNLGISFLAMPKNDKEILFKFVRPIVDFCDLNHKLNARIYFQSRVSFSRLELT